MAFLKSTIQDVEEEDDISVIKQLNAASCGGAYRIQAWNWRTPFKIFATVVLSLLLPFSFLLLARISAAHYLSLVDDSGHHQFSAVVASFFFIYNGKSIILYTLVAIVTAASFIHVLTSIRLPLNSKSPTPEPVSRHPTAKLYIAWFLLFMFQVYVGVGIEWSISAGVNDFVFSEMINNDIYIIITRALLFVGLHETMSFWSKYIVKPVVEDTVTGRCGGGGGSQVVAVAVERIGVALSLVALWWFKLRDEVDALMVVPELILSLQRRRDLVVAVAEEFYVWWLYSLTVSIGTMRVLKGIIWVVTAVLTSRRKDFIETSDSVFQSSRHQPPPLEDVV